MTCRQIVCCMDSISSKSRLHDAFACHHHVTKITQKLHVNFDDILSMQQTVCRHVKTDLMQFASRYRCELMNAWQASRQAGRQECHLELLRDCLCCLRRLVLLCQLGNLALYLREDVLLQPLNQHLQAKSHSASCFQHWFEQHASSKMQMTVRMRKLGLIRSCYIQIRRPCHTCYQTTS